MQYITGNTVNLRDIPLQPRLIASKINSAVEKPENAPIGSIHRNKEYGDTGGKRERETRKGGGSWKRKGKRGTTEERGREENGQFRRQSVVNHLTYT
jgi:hypothetical protein